MKARKRCAWNGCQEPRAPGRGCTKYCEAHRIVAAREKAKLKRRRQRQRQAQQDRAALEMASNDALEFKIRFLLGRA